MAAIETGDDGENGPDESSPVSSSRMSPDIYESIAKSLSIPELIGLNVERSILPSMVPSFTVPILPKLPKLGFEVPSLASMGISNLDPVKLGIGSSFVSSILGDIGNSSLLGIAPGMDSLFSRIIPTFDFLKGLDLDLSRGAWPTNLENLDWDQEDLTRLTLYEGLPIAWVPRLETMQLIFEAETPAKRRAVYGRRWRGIIEDCQQLAEKMDSARLAPYVRYLHGVIDALRGGYWLAAQALAASTLDTVAFELAGTTLRNAKRPDKITEPGKLPVRTFFLWSQLAGIYKSFRREDGDPVPGTFNRHGATHGVSYRQYSRLNATLGMAHLTSLMWILDSQTRQPGRAKTSRSRSGK